MLADELLNRRCGTPAREQLGDAGPLVAENVMCSHDGCILLGCEWALLDIWVELVEPPAASIPSKHFHFTYNAHPLLVSSQPADMQAVATS